MTPDNVLTRYLPTQLGQGHTIQFYLSKLSSGRTRSGTALGHSAGNQKREQTAVNYRGNGCLLQRYPHLSMVSSDFPYKVGGSLAWNDPSYLKRPADFALQTALSKRQFAYVLGPRQMGKSSLRVQAVHQVAQLGGRCVSVQATQLHSDDERDFLYVLYTELVSDDLDRFLQWLALTEALSMVERLVRFVDDFLADLLSVSDVVVFVDEIDALLETPLNSVLFSWMTKCYELRSSAPRYRRLNFVVLGSVIASDLPCSGVLLPQGCEVLISPFQLVETDVLKAGFEKRLDAPDVLMAAIYRWTKGQPFLTQKLCRTVLGVMDSLVLPSAKPIQLSSRVVNQWVDDVVRSHIIQDWQTQDEPIHLRAISRRINESYNKKALFQLYKTIFLGKSVKANGSYTQAELILSSLVSVEGDYLQVANEIYRSIFQI